MANEFIIRKGYKSLAASEVTGSLRITGDTYAGKFRLGNTQLYASGDNNHIHFIGTALIGTSTTASSNPSIGTATYPFKLVQAGFLYAGDGSASAPAISFRGFTDDGMYREVYDTDKSTVSFATEGVRRARIFNAGIWSDANVYATSQFRSFANPWDATQGTSGAGFRFRNTADSNTLLEIDGSGNTKVLGNLMPSTDGGGSLGAGTGTNLRWGGLELQSGAGIQWQNGDARIIEGLVNNYSLSFQTYDGSSMSTALRLDGNNTATFGGTITTSGKISGGEIEGTSLDINGAADIAGKLVINTNSDDILTLNQVTSGTKWNYINFNQNGTREWFIGQDTDGNFDLYNDVINAYAITVHRTDNTIGLNGDVLPGAATAYADSTHNLGSSSKRWANIYSDAISVLGQGTFDTINTGQGATEVHLMNQNLRTTDNVTFPKITAAQGTTYANGYRLTRTGHDTYRIALGNSQGLRIINETDSNREELTFDGVGNAEFGGNVTVAGTLTAQEFKTELISASIVFESGSTIFGNSSDDTHVFTGSITAKNTVDGDYTGLRIMNQKTYGSGTGTNETARLVLGIAENGQADSNREGFVIETYTADESDSSNINTEFKIRDGGTIGTAMKITGANKNVDFYNNVNLQDNKMLLWGGNSILKHTGTATEIGDNSSSSTISISGGATTFANDINLTAGQVKLRGDEALDHDGSSLYIKAPSSIYFYPGNSNKANLSTAGTLQLAGVLDVNGTGTSTFASHVQLASSKYLEFSGQGALINMDVAAWSNASEHNLLYAGWVSNLGDYLSFKVPGNGTTNHGNLILSDNLLSYGRMDSTTSAAATDSATNPHGDDQGAAFLVTNTGNATFAGGLTVGGLIDLGSGAHSIKKTANTSGNHPAIELYSSGTGDSGAAIAIQQATSEGDTIIFADYEPHVEWGISAENGANEIHFTAGSSTNSLGSKTFKNNAGSNRTAYKKMTINLGSGNVAIGGTTTIGGRTDLQKDLRLRGNDSSGNIGVVRFFTDANDQLIIDTGNDGSNRTIIDGSGNTTFAGSVTLNGVDVGGSTSPTLYLGQLTNAFQAGMQSSIHLTMKVTNASHNFYWYRGGSSVMYYTDALYVNKIVDKDSSSYYLDPGSTGTSLNVAGDATLAGDLTVSGGDITLGGTGRIQGIDTVQDSTDAANKAYVDANSGGISNVVEDTTPQLGGNLDTNGKEINEGGSTTFSIDLKDHNNYTWLRNETGVWTFQAGTAGDDWTRSFQFKVNSTDSDGDNENWMELGQRVSNDTHGEHRGVRIRKFESSAVVDGDFQAGLGYFTGDSVVGVTDAHTAGIFLPTASRGVSALFGSSYARNLIKSDGSSTIEIGGNTSLISLIKLNAGSSSTNGVVSFMTKGSERMRVHHDGNVGIATTSPGHLLEVRGTGDALSVGDDSNTQTYMRFANERTMIGYSGANAVVQGGLSKGIRFNVNDNTFNSGTAMTINSSGNVGVGTTSPSNKLHVYGGSSHDVIARFEAVGTGTGDYSEIHIANNNNDRLILGSIGSNYNNSSWAGMRYVYSTAGDLGLKAIASSGNVRIYAGGAGSERMRITSAGRVGIGTTSPATTLDVEGGSLGSTSGDTKTAAIIRAGRQNIIFKDTRTANDSDWRNATFKIIAQIDSTDHQSIDFVNDNNYYEHIDIRTGNQVFHSRFTFDGKLGIGTTSPSTKLEVAGDVKVTGTASGVNIDTAGHASLRLDRASTSYDNNILFNTNGDIKFRIWQDGNSDYLYIRDDDNATNMVTFKKGGNVGIGTTGPDAPLSIHGATGLGIGASGLRVHRPDSFGQFGFFDYGQSSGTTYIGSSYTGGTAANYGVITFRQLSNGGSAQDTMTISSDNRVGIGTTTPSTKFHVVGAAVDNESLGLFTNNHSGGGVFYPALKAVHTHSNHSYGTVAEFRTEAGAGTDRPSILFTNAHADHYWTVGQGGYTATDNFAITYRNFHPNTGSGWGTARLIIDTTGRVGIGTTSPSNKLEVFTSAASENVFSVNNGTQRLQLGVNNSQGSFVFEQSANALRFGTTNTERMRISSAGNVGIGTTNPTYTLQVQGTGYFNSTLYVNGTTTINDDLIIDHNIIGNSKNFATSNAWESGSGTQTGYYGGNFGGDSQGMVKYDVGPFGSRELIQETVPDTGNDYDGGWNKTITELDINKAHMSVVYVKRITSQASGNFYHGTGTSSGQIQNLNGTNNTNPYFQATGVSNLPENVWCVSIGFIQANNDTNTDTGTQYNSRSGIYRLDTGQKINNGAVYKFGASGATLTNGHRTFLYYSTDNVTKLQFARPGFYEMNGDAPTFESLVGKPVAIQINQSGVPTLAANVTAAEIRTLVSALRKDGDDTTTGNLTISKGSNPVLHISSTDGGSAILRIGRTIDTQAEILAGDQSASDLCFKTGGSRRIQLTSGGQLNLYGNFIQSANKTFLSGYVSTSNLNSVWQTAGTSREGGILPFRFQASATNAPGTNNNANWGLNIYSHAGSGGGYPYGLQLAGSDAGSGENSLQLRTVSNGTFSSWKKVFHEGHLPTMAEAGVTTATVEALGFLRSDAADTSTGEILFDAGFKSDSILLTGPQNFDNISRSGFYNLYNTATSSTNSPPFTYGTMIVVGGNKQNNSFGLQIAHERTGTGLYVRGMNDSSSTWYDWDEIWTSGTDGAGSGLDADLLDAMQPKSATGAAGSNQILRTHTNGYLYMQNWIDVGTAGLFSTTTNSAHLRPNASSDYGTWRVDGTRNGYGGIVFAYGTSPRNGLIGKDDQIGIYNDHDNEWLIRANHNAEVTLYHNGSKKLDTTSAGVTVTGNVTHDGLTMTSGTDIDQLYSVNMTYTLSANTWTDTGINSSELATGTYAIQLFVDDHSAGGGHYDVVYSGMMSWYGNNTNSGNHDEIVLHRVGHATNNSIIQLRTLMHFNAGDNVMLQIKQNFTHTAAMSGTTDGRRHNFKFRRLI